MLWISLFSQTALHSVLDRTRDMNLQSISVNHIVSEENMNFNIESKE